VKSGLVPVIAILFLFQVDTTPKATGQTTPAPEKQYEVGFPSLLGKSRRRQLTVLSLFLLLVLSVVSCGGDGGGGGGGNPTPPGNYSIIVNGSAGSVQASTGVQLTVQ
jgi:hypothetical protein